MATAQDIHEYIEKNSISKSKFHIIKNESFLLLFDGEDCAREFKHRNKSEKQDFFKIPDKASYENVLVRTKISIDNLIQGQVENINEFTLPSEKIFFLDNIEFNGLCFKEDFILNIADAYNASVSFRNCRFMGKVKIRNMEYGDYQKSCENKTVLERLEFIDCEMSAGGEYNNLFLRVGFLNVDFFSLHNTRVPAGAEVNIGDCHFKNFRLSNFRNLGKFKLYKINENDEANSNYKFQIDNTSIGDTDFQSVNLVSFTERVIFDNILSGINYTNVQWEDPGTDIKVGQCNPGSKTEIAKKRDTYRVLKNVAQRNDDMQQALAFYSKEIEWHRKLIKGNANKWLERVFVFFVNYTEKIERYGKLNRGNTNKWFDEVFLFFVHYIKKIKWFIKSIKGKINKRLDRVVLFFGRWTNNHGQNWLWPIGVILFFGVIFYAGLLWIFPGDVWVAERWKKFPLFLNPTHKIEFMCEDHWGFWAYTIDTLFRVFEGMLIYQTIQAFRKYSRKF